MEEIVKLLVRDVPNFPEDGVHFKDISLLNDVSCCRYITNRIVKEIGHDPLFDIVLGLDARGFIFGPQIAEKVNVGFGMIRKTGKLPPPYVEQGYDLEYKNGSSISLSSNIVKPGMRVHLHDDVLATGGTIEAAVKLVEKLGANVVSVSFVIELTSLNGIKKLENYSRNWCMRVQNPPPEDIKVFSLLKY